MEIREEPFGNIGEYARIPVAFSVDRVLELTLCEGERLGFRLHEQPVTTPWIKNYDAEDGNHPTRWHERFDVSNWTILSAWIDGDRIGGAVVAFGTSNVHALEGRSDLAALWDLRVKPDSRRRGVGSALFGAAETWGRARGCRQLRVETQNINVNACRFYESRGCVLGAVHRFAYPQLPGEIQLLWYKDLGTP